MVIQWSKYAKNDLKSYFYNSKTHSKEKLKKYIYSLINYINLLQFSPNLGKTFYKYKNIQIQQLVFNIHKIFYYIQNNKIIIIHISNNSKDSIKIENFINKFF